MTSVPITVYATAGEVRIDHYEATDRVEIVSDGVAVYWQPACVIARCPIVLRFGQGSRAPRVTKTVKVRIEVSGRPVPEVMIEAQALLAEAVAKHLTEGQAA